MWEFTLRHSVPGELLEFIEVDKGGSQDVFVLKFSLLRRIKEEVFVVSGGVYFFGLVEDVGDVKLFSDFLVVFFPA